MTTITLTFNNGQELCVNASSLSDALRRQSVAHKGGVKKYVISKEFSLGKGRLLPLSETTGMNKHDLCELYGVLSYDGALPQDWLDRTSERLKIMRTAVGRSEQQIENSYHDIMFGTVWSYDGPLFGGQLQCLNREIYEDLLCLEGVLPDGD